MGVGGKILGCLFLSLNSVLYAMEARERKGKQHERSCPEGAYCSNEGSKMGRQGIGRWAIANVVSPE